MAVNFRKKDSSCTNLATDTTIFYQCLKCDHDCILYICKDCKTNGDHKGHTFKEEEDLDLVKFCNCGDGTGRYFCSNHPQNELPRDERPLFCRSDCVRQFSRILDVDRKLAVKISRTNQLTALDMKSSEGLIIQNYFDNTNAHNYEELEIKKCWKVYRKDKEINFATNGYDKTRRMLLWHGTKKGNLSSILDNGFRKPERDGVKNGSMFGKGIYFADRVSKSVQYCDQEGYGLLFLCEVALGSMWRTGLPKDYENVPDEFQSIKGLGKCIPDKRGETKFDDIIVPSGKTVENSHPKIKYSHLQYNEYIVFDPDRVLIKFIISFKLNPSSCSIQ